MSESRLEEQFNHLRRAYAERITSKIEQIEALFLRLTDGDEGGAVIQELHALIYSMVGTAATFDFSDLSARAMELAVILEGVSRHDHSPDAREITVMRTTFMRICEAGRDILLSLDIIGAFCPVSFHLQELPLDKQVFICSSDQELLRKLGWELNKRSCSVRLFPDYTALRLALDNEIPASVILDFSAGWPEKGHPLVFPESCQDQIAATPVVIIAQDGDVRTRLAGVRLGGTHFFTKPFSFNKLLRLVLAQNRDPNQDPYRVLLVEDDEILCQLYRIILEGAGIQVESLNEPLGMMEILDRFQPDLLIFDIYMPIYNGIDLACVIRQSDRFFNLPILFLSSEMNVRRFLVAHNLYLEEHLSKPVQPANLVRTANHLIRKYRVASNTTKELHAALRELDNLQYIVNQHAIVSATDIQGNITFVNDRFCEISGFMPHELIGQNHRILKSGYHTEAVYQELWRTISSGKVWHGQIKNRRRDGTSYWVEATIVPILNDKGKPQEYVSIRTDITRQKQEETRAQSMALFAEMNPAPVLRVNTNWEILQANVAASAILGLENHGESGSLVTLIPEVKRLDLVRCIQEDLTEDLEVKIRDRAFNFAIHGVSELGVAHLYCSDITARKQMEDELRLAKDSAERANRAKSEFLSSMSHELRTPMNAVLGFSQLLLTDPTEPLTENQKDSLEEITSAGHHLLELINEVLDLAKVEAGKVQLTLEDVSLQDVIDESLKLVTTLADQRSVSITVCDPVSHCGEVIVSADRTRLKQVVLNLLSNAIKYNRPGGMVQVRCARCSVDRIRVNVVDTGVGIAQEKLEAVFEPFNRLGAEKTAVEGTGIGLLITKRLVEMMGGIIGVESRLGHGSTFWIELTMVELLESDNVCQVQGELALETEEIAPMVSSHSLLYIEDNPANIKLVERILKRRPDLKLFSAPAPALGLDLAQVNLPTVILLDINLPGMDGFEVLCHLKENPITRHIPVIAISANAMPGMVETGLAAGFLRYLTKPLNVELFMEALDAALVVAQRDKE